VPTRKLKTMDIEFGNKEFEKFVGREIFVYPICTLQEEFREYSVLKRLKDNNYLDLILNPTPTLP
jgi:hypothetical protein